MSYLESFTKDQRELLISLPYRTGLWMSESDDSGGDDSQEAELKTLESLMIGYSEDFLKSEFVEEIIRSTLKDKSMWAEWGKNLDLVPQQCKQAIKVLQERMEAKDILSFRQALLEIATAIAMAYREIDENDLVFHEKCKIYIEYYWQYCRALIKKETLPSLDSFLNISHAENQVLMALSEALKLDKNGHPVSNS